MLKTLPVCPTPSWPFKLRPHAHMSPFSSIAKVSWPLPDTATTRTLPVTGSQRWTFLGTHVCKGTAQKRNAKIEWCVNAAVQTWCCFSH